MSNFYKISPLNNTTEPIITFLIECGFDMERKLLLNGDWQKLKSKIFPEFLLERFPLEYVPHTEHKFYFKLKDTNITMQLDESASLKLAMVNKRQLLAHGLFQIRRVYRVNINTPKDSYTTYIKQGDDLSKLKKIISEHVKRYYRDNRLNNLLNNEDNEDNQ